MRGAAILSAAMALAGCGGQPPSPQAAGEDVVISPDDLPDDWLERLRTTPMPSNVATNDEFRIEAVFRPDDPVCVSDSGGHIHGFYQAHGLSCGSDRADRKRYVSVYADYNAMEYSWDKAVREICGVDSEPIAIGMAPTSRGQLEACRPRRREGDYTITVLYLADPPDMTFGDAVAGGGPDLVYYVWLGIGAETEAADIAEGRDFLGNLHLAGSGFRPAAS